MANAFYFAGNLTGTMPALGSMTSVGTSWSSQHYDGSTSGAGDLHLTIYAFSLCNFGSQFNITAYSLAFSCSQTFDPGQIAPKSCVCVVEYSADSTDGSNGSWTQIGTHSLSIINTGGGGPTTFTATGLTVTGNMVRIRYTDVTGCAVSPLDATITASAFSLTATQQTCISPPVPIIAAVGVIVGLDSNQMFGGTPEILINGT